MSKYGALIKEARKQESQKTSKPASSPKEPKEAKEPDVNLSIKVAAARRRHWASQAKLRGITLTAAITEALSERFGEPE
jgi:hypothetical protein